jgi:hypothetical protein
MRPEIIPVRIKGIFFKFCGAAIFCDPCPSNRRKSNRAKNPDTKRRNDIRHADGLFLAGNKSHPLLPFASPFSMACHLSFATLAIININYQIVSYDFSV